jgi:lipoxygenase
MLTVHLNLVQDSQALEHHKVFVEAVKRCEATFEERNASDSLMRGTGTLPYTFMLPSSGPGRTGRGVPYSITV